MTQDEIRKKLLNAIHKVRPDINPGDNDNLFGLTVNCQAVDMVYIILEIQNEFGISIGDEFIERIQNTTMNNLMKALADVLR